jgi:hypothetical protein
MSEGRHWLIYIDNIKIDAFKSLGFKYLGYSLMNSPNSPEDLGNDETKSSNAKKQGNRASNWVFNIHFGPDKEYKEWKEFKEYIKKKREHFKLYRFAEEYGKSGETPHVQGAVIMKERKRMTEMKKILGTKIVRLEVMKGDWEDQEYCGKEGYDLLTNDRKIRKISKDMLWEWQLECVSWFEEYCDIFDRKVHWIRGDCQGKSMVCKYLIDNEESIVVEGKNTDILYGIAEYVKCHLNSPKIVIVDIPKVNCGAEVIKH